MLVYVCQYFRLINNNNSYIALYPVNIYKLAALMFVCLYALMSFAYVCMFTAFQNTFFVANLGE